MAKLSVIVPAYNAETTLRTAVESILSPVSYTHLTLPTILLV